MARGIDLQLFAANGTTPLASTTFRMVWLDTSDDLTGILPPAPVSYAVTTDATGWLHLDLERISGLALGATGFLILYSKNSGDFRNSLMFASKMTITNVTGGVDPFVLTDFYERHPDWPASPVMTPGVQKFTGLLQVYDHDSNYIALLAQGDFTVDWGDGNVENFSSNATATHLYSYSSVSGTIVGTSYAVAVTFTDAGDLVNYTAHPYANGQVVNFASIVTTTGISINTRYYVVNATTNTFQVATTIGGSALALTGNGSGTVFIPEYKVVTVNVTPQAGQSLSYVNLQKVPAGQTAFPNAPWAEIAINSTALSALIVGLVEGGVGFQQLKYFQLGENAVTNFSGTLIWCKNLRIASMNLASATRLDRLFDSCVSLKAVSITPSPSCTLANDMFTSCLSLVIAPAINLPAATDIASIFYNCPALQSAPVITAPVATSARAVFNFCTAMTYCPAVSLPSAIDVLSFFEACTSLKSVGPINLPAATGMSSFFGYCGSLEKVPSINATSASDVSGMFSNCTSLASVPSLNLPAITLPVGMFSFMPSLQVIPPLNLSGVSDDSFINGFIGYPNGGIVSAPVTGVAVSWDISFQRFSAASLNQIFTNLGTVTGKTIWITGNPGAATCNQSIATGKGWTVVN